ncbi:glycoside hydrolase family 27 protein [Flavobacterium sp. GT3P67]|uniref:glycoside hydrolase family 27 protein n=1 Tax=Flavobacterium sp. GT3P67 TaxID=2541722 RepID=UPI00104D435D|nr:glycoside hydrolase family 27 protein [Flavobacterium sp. GT3P67]TDE48485.1 glycoside hydrolase family 27 protein [Flavobacterium sp. GT3P67]
MKKQIIGLFVLALCLTNGNVEAQSKSIDGTLLAPTPPMGWMTWNYFADNINEKDIREMADAMVSSGMLKAGYNHVFIDDGWQGGRDKRNNMIADPKKFPSGIKALADYVHSKGLKLGIYSDAAPLTCAGYTASLNFEDQDAKIFASWDVDYLKYDYCGAPDDMEVAKTRYKKIADALRKSGRDIALGICEWGDRKPWLWAGQVGGQLWRTTADVRDKWKSLKPVKKQSELHGTGAGILDIVDYSQQYGSYAGPGHWNDMDMLVVGLYGKKGPSGDLGGVGCTDTEYQSQMSLWSIMNSPLAATNDVRNMNAETKRILLNEEVIAINQDALGKQAVCKIKNDTWSVFVKSLANGDFAIAILNRTETTQNSKINFAELGLNDTYEIKDLWEHKVIGKGKKWNGKVQRHETKVFRLKKI